MVIPRALREEAGVSEGALMKVAVVKGGKFLLTPQLVIDHTVAPNRRKNRKQILRELAVAVADLRQDAKEKGLDKMPMSEINRAVAAMRRDLKKEASKRSAR